MSTSKPYRNIISSNGYQPTTYNCSQPDHMKIPISQIEFDAEMARIRDQATNALPAIKIASSTPVYSDSGIVQISGLITCVAVAVEKIEPATREVAKVVAGHFVTPTMYSEGALTAKGRFFLDQLKALMAEHNLAFDQNTELMCYYAPRLDGQIHHTTQEVMQLIGVYMGAPVHEQASKSTVNIRVNGHSQHIPDEVRLVMSAIDAGSELDPVVVKRHQKGGAFAYVPPAQRTRHATPLTETFSVVSGKYHVVGSALRGVSHVPAIYGNRKDRDRARVIDSIRKNYRCRDPDCMSSIEELDPPVLVRQDGSMYSEKINVKCAVCGDTSDKITVYY